MKTRTLELTRTFTSPFKCLGWILEFTIYNSKAQLTALLELQSAVQHCLDNNTAPSKFTIDINMTLFNTPEYINNDNFEKVLRIERQMNNQEN